MPRSRSRLAPALVALAPLACKGPPPDQVRLELPELVTSTDPVHATVHARRGGTSQVTSENLEFSLQPPDVAQATKAGNLTCAKSGDAKVTVSIQGATATGTLRCRLVDRLEIGELPLVDLSKPPVVLSVHAVSTTGAEFTDVPVTLTTDSPRVLSVTGTTLTPMAVGETSVTVHAGSKTKQLQVRVVRSVAAEALPLEGGHRIYFGLPEGKYEVEVSLPVDRTLSVEWRGAPYCAYKGSGRTHRSSCVLQSKGGAVVDNPAFLTNGAT
jgi:hypothetical protein